ncbi:MAG: protein tyrosine/serine phosphatase [Ilumatobacteraceae bacterium]|nr:protein tyrosine/serine phosphatase [Ilumatobacteraceae bacterium]
MTTGWIELEGAHNVRDLGGLSAGSGRTRSGVLLRSDALHELTDDDVRQLVDVVGVAHVVDLRSSSERLERGRGPLGASAVRYTELEVIGPEDLARRAATRAASFAAGLPPARILSDGYVELLELGAPAFTEAFRRIGEPGGAPALVHCAIGKDRTGVLIALLLDAAGVDRAEIVVDYARSGERMAPIIARWTSANETSANASSALTEQLAAFTAMAVPETMEHVLDHVHEQWDGAAGFFVANGVAPDSVDAWRQCLVGPA